MTTRPTWLDDNWAMVPIVSKPRSRRIDILAAEPCDDPDCEICESIRAPYRDEPVRTDPAADELKEYIRQLESERNNLQNALDSMSFTCDLMKQQHSSIVRKSKKQKKRLTAAKKLLSAFAQLETNYAGSSPSDAVFANGCVYVHAIRSAAEFLRNDTDD